MKKSFVKYLIELIIVAFGVFLGMMVSEWRANQKADKNTTKSLIFIIEELKSNSLKLKEMADYHNTIKIGFDSMYVKIPENVLNGSYFTNIDKFNKNRIPHWRGVGIARMDDVAFETAKVSGVFQNLDVDITQLISKPYVRLKDYSEFGKSNLDNFVSINSETKVRDVTGYLEMLIHDVRGMEESLSLNLDQTIKKLIQMNGNIALKQ